jgi:hypothetical protein
MRYTEQRMKEIENVLNNIITKQLIIQLKTSNLIASNIYILFVSTLQYHMNVVVSLHILNLFLYRMNLITLKLGLIK